MPRAETTSREGPRLRSLFCAVVLPLIAAMPAGSAVASPNFILILADDLGWTSLSAPMDHHRPEARSDFYRTPNLDELVGMGMRFSNGYAAAPVCSPTRYSIQFGKTPARLLRTRSEKRNLARHDHVSIPQVLKRIDPAYLAAHFGKWHIDVSPAELGYDEHDGITDNAAGGFVNDASQWDGYAVDDPKRAGSLTQRAIEFMRAAAERDQPFFLQLSHYAVHSSIEYSRSAYASFSEREPGERHTNRGFAAMLLDLDASIGALLRAYESLGLADDTYLLFVSDNGGMPVIPMQVNLGRPYPKGLNEPLLRGKWDLTEGGIRVPFAVVGPTVAPGSQSDTPVTTYDLLPTIAELAAGKRPELPGDIDGGSLRPVLVEPGAAVVRPLDSLVFHFPHYNRVGMTEPHSAIRRGNYKLIHFPVSKRSLLFDLASDPGERRDLAKQRPLLRSELEKKLADYLGSVDAERPQDGSKWESVGKEGKVRTQFFQRYDGDGNRSSAIQP